MATLVVNMTQTSLQTKQTDTNQNKWSVILYACATVGVEKCARIQLAANFGSNQFNKARIYLYARANANATLMY